MNRRIKVLQTSALPLGYRATLVQFSILDSRTEARSISRKPRTDASALRRAQLSRSTFCLRYAATPPSSQTPRARGTPRLTRPQSRPRNFSRGRHQGVRRGCRRCVPALPPRRQATSLSQARTTLSIHLLSPLRRVDFGRLSRCPSGHSCFRPDRGRSRIRPAEPRLQ